MKRNNAALGLMLFLLAFGLVLSGCDLSPQLDGNNDGNTGSKPSQLSDNASYDEAIAKLDAIIAYCDANPNAANNAVKISAAGYRTSISNYGGSVWSSYSSSIITAINLYIDQLQPVNDSGNNNGNNNNNNGGNNNTSSKPSPLSDNASYDEAIAKLDAIIAYCDANPNTANSAVRISAAGYKTSISNFGGSVWSSYRSSVITAINLYIDQLQTVNDNGNDNSNNGSGNNNDNNIGGDNNTGSKPSQLSDNASYDEAIAKLDAIIAYCDANPNAANSAVRISAAGYKLAISNYSGSLWIAYSSSVITAINSYIDQLQEVNDNNNSDKSGNNGNSPGNNGGGLEVWFKGTPVVAGFPSGTTAAALVTSICQVSTWYEFIAMGGELYVNDVIVTSGSPSILPYAWVIVLAPGSNSNSNKGYPVDPETDKLIVYEGPCGKAMPVPASTTELLVPYIFSTLAARPDFTWSKFTAAGGELYVNSLKITKDVGILPDDWVKVLIPEAALAALPFGSPVIQYTLW